MQTLKEEIRNAIVAAAIAEFREKGYRSASMRAIAEAAGITVGNVYRYFESKDALFRTIMEPVSRQLVNMVYADRYLESEGKLLDMDTVMESIMSLCKNHTAEMHILVYKSEGSEFEGVRRRLTDMISERLSEPDGYSEKWAVTLRNNPDMSRVLSAAFVEGVFEILKQNQNDINTLEGNIRCLILFFFQDLYPGLAH